MGLSNPQGGYPSQGFGGKGPAQQQVGYQPANRATGAPASLTPSMQTLPQQGGSQPWDRLTGNPFYSNPWVQGLQSWLQPTGFGGKGPPQELPPQPRVAQPRVAPQRQYRV